MTFFQALKASKSLSNEMLNEQSRSIVIDITSMYRMKVSCTERKFRPTRAHRTSLSDHVSRPLNQSKRTFKANDKETGERACAGVRRTKNEYAGCRSQHFTKIRTQVERRRMGTRIRESLESVQTAAPSLRHVNKSVCPRSTRSENRGRNSFFFFSLFLLCGEKSRMVTVGRDEGGQKGGTHRGL